MLTTARPIFEHVPASFADPVGLADQQAPGVVALIVVRYGPPEPDLTPTEGTAPFVLGTTYDAFVAVSGQLLAVARSTPDYRYPVTPAVALAHFLETRDAGRPAFLSLFELDEDACARFLETVFYAECLKLHVRGAASAALVARQIALSGCGDGLPSGVLEINDFSDPAAPRIRLVDLDGLLDTEPSADDAPDAPDPLEAVLATYLDGVTGRVLLYDRAKNQATLPHRTGRPFDLDAAIAQASRLADARRLASRPPSADAVATATPLPVADVAGDPADDAPLVTAVEGYLRDRAARPRLVDPAHPHAAGLGALVAELQGGRPAPDALFPTPPTATPNAPPLPSEPPAPTTPAGFEAPTHPPLGGEPAADVIRGVGEAADREASAQPTGRRSQPGGPPAEPSPHTPATTPPTGPRATRRHPLATDLDRLRADVFALFEDAVGRERAVAHEAHVLDASGIRSPVAAEDTVAYLRALLTDEPPRRWHFFKRARARTYEEVAGKLLAFHAANGHLDTPAHLDILHDVTRLWTRLHQ